MFGSQKQGYEHAASCVGEEKADTLCACLRNTYPASPCCTIQTLLSIISETTTTKLILVDSRTLIRHPFFGCAPTSTLGILVGLGRALDGKLGLRAVLLHGTLSSGLFRTILK